MADPTDWMGEAEEDLDAARKLVQERLAKHDCFFGQQAVEKALKSVLLKRTGRIPKTHDLEELFGRLRATDPSLPDHRPALLELQPYYSLVRYPDTRTPGTALPTANEAEDACRKAGAIVGDLRGRIA